VNFIADFIAGRTHRLARDFMVAGFVIIMLSFGAVSLLTKAIDEFRVASRQNMPARLAATGPTQTQTQTIVRSVLDDNVTTASIGGRTIILDPCTGKEKK
jgi:hypothetical protein